MRATLVIAVSVLFVAGLCGIVVAGSLDSPGAPTAGSQMYTLLDIYNYLNSGTAAPTPGPFQEPGAGPGSTMKTTRQIYDDIKAKLDQCNATTAYDVALGKPFFCTVAGSWGIQTGKVCISGTPTPTPTPTFTPMDPAACAALGGWFAAQGSEVPGNGCWFYSASKGLSCDSVCTAKSLRCAHTNWNDDTNASACKHFVTNSPSLFETSASGAYPMVEPNGWPDYHGADRCYRRSEGYPQNCSETVDGNYYKRLCVCEPNP
ncbi:MAG: hypothetical protein NTZ78_09470 [Candidatus Aureabacteria bacterium]|nr:hypothetical protein [Candidatus Auribacterota bacterium]